MLNNLLYTYVYTNLFNKLKFYITSTLQNYDYTKFLEQIKYKKSVFCLYFFQNFTNYGLGWSAILYLYTLPKKTKYIFINILKPIKF